MKRTFDHDALQPLAQSLLQRARRDADAVVADAQAAADDEVAKARQQAEQILAQARERGTAEGRHAADVARSGAQRQARSAVLQARRTAADEIRRAAREAVRALAKDDQYPAVRRALADRARAVLGQEATITDLADGGIAATAGGRTIRYSLDDLADEILARGTGDGEASP